MTWDEGDTDLNLTAPDGTTYTPQNVAGYPNVHYYKDADGKEAVFEVAGPAGGTWQVTVTETAGIGGYRLESRRSTDAPVITLLQPQNDLAGGPVNIAWVDEDSDSDAVISLYYDTDRRGADGVLIATGVSQDNDPDSYVWDTTGVPTGDYYVYAVISDGNNVPAICYSTGRVRVVDPDGPAALTGLNAPEGTDTSVRLVWDTSSAPDLSHYLVRLTSDAAGEFYEQTVAASQAETLISDLTPGETYRVTVAAVDTGGHIGQESSPIIVVAGGTATVPPEAGQWDVFAQPGAQYQAQVPGGAGEVFVLVDGPAGATLDGSGLFRWNVPSSGAEGWHQVLVHVTLSDGTKEVRRYCLLTDGTNPTFAAGTVQVAAGSSSSLTITAPAGRDVSGVLQYRLERDGAVVGAWQTSPVFSDSGLQPNTAYSYRVQERESAPAGRTTEWSVAAVGQTLAAVPGALMFDQVTSSTAAVEGFAADGNPPTTEYAILNTTTGMYAAADGTASPMPVWRTAAEWTGTSLGGLEPDHGYAFQARARNAGGLETELGLASVVRTARETTPPVVSRATANYSTGTLALEFSEAVALSVKDLAVTDSNGSPVDIAGATFSHEAGSTRATLSFNGTLAEGRYTLKVKGTSVQDLSSNLLDGNGDGQAGDDYSFAFSRLAGDTNGDAKVNIFDLLKVRQNYLKAADDPTRDDNADVTGDGAVNIFDLLMVRQNYLRELAPVGGGSGLGTVQPLTAMPTAIQTVEVPPVAPIEVAAAPAVAPMPAGVAAPSTSLDISAALMREGGITVSTPGTQISDDVLVAGTAEKVSPNLDQGALQEHETLLKKVWARRPRVSLAVGKPSRIA
jgi:hypothetical protein